MAQPIKMTPMEYATLQRFGDEWVAISPNISFNEPGFTERVHKLSARGILARKPATEKLPERFCLSKRGKKALSGHYRIIDPSPRWWEKLI